ncbi:MAG: Ppx/GppA family phosphatase [Rhodobacteraceae bacterium]|nr:Ppx/GppA family phosphatase [Paracoccaceae bacterium]
MTPRRSRRTVEVPKSVDPAVTPYVSAEPYAALDLGTNSCRMLIARAEGDQLRVIDSFSKAVQLGAGLESSGVLSRMSVRRTVQALRVCRRKLEQHRVTRMRLVATEACRRASNGSAFIQQVRRETGLVLDVITPEEEARLAVVSCGPLVQETAEQLLVVDIGGGSTELVWIDLSGVAPGRRSAAIMAMHCGSFQEAGNGARVVDWISVPLGVATLRDKFADVEDDAGAFALMSWYFEEHLADFAPYAAVHKKAGFQIVGTSGTVTTVAASHLGLRRYDRSQVDGLVLSSDEIDTVIREYLRLGPEGRRKDPRIGRDRHTLIMPGAAILQALMRLWPTDRLSVADRGLREGLLYAQMSADGLFSAPAVQVTNG